MYKLDFLNKMHNHCSNMRSIIKFMANMDFDNTSNNSETIKLIAIWTKTQNDVQNFSGWINRRARIPILDHKPQLFSVLNKQGLEALQFQSQIMQKQEEVRIWLINPKKVQANQKQHVQSKRTTRATTFSLSDLQKSIPLMRREVEKKKKKKKT